MKTTTISGTYGSSKTPCDVFVCENRNGSSWYVVEGGQVVNLTYEQLTDGVDVEEVSDVDAFTWSGPIESEEELLNAVEA
jgi:hypothetical protein